MGVIGTHHQIVFPHAFKNIGQIFVDLTSNVDSIVFENIRRKLDRRHAKHTRALTSLLLKLLATEIVSDEWRSHRACLDATDAQLGKPARNFM